VFSSKESDVVLVMRIFDKTELSDAQQQLLATEARILRQLHHPNVVETVREHETDARLCQVFQLSVVSGVGPPTAILPPTYIRFTAL